MVRPALGAMAQAYGAPPSAAIGAAAQHLCRAGIAIAAGPWKPDYIHWHIVR